MTEEVKLYLTRLMKSVEGLMAIIFTDRDGVPILKVATEQAPELALRHNFLGTFSMAADSASKLGLSQNKSIVCMYGNHQVIQINQSPILLTFIASHDANTGLLLDMDRQLKDVIHDLQRVIPAS